MPKPAMVKPVKTPTAYTPTRMFNLGVGPDEEGLGGDGEDDDPVREHEPVAAPGELAGEEGVLGDEAGEVREPVEARVAACPEDQHRRGLHEEEAEPARTRPEPKTYFASWESTVGVPDTYGTAWVMWASSDTPSTSEPRMIDMMTSTRRALRPFGRAEVGDPVRDRLEAGERRPAVGEGPQHDDDRGAVQKAAPGRAERHDAGVVDRVGVQLAEGGPDQADDDERPGRGDEEVGRQGEDAARPRGCRAGCRST